MDQLKEQNKFPKKKKKKELNKMEISNLPELVIRMLKELTGYFYNIKKKNRQK